MILLRFAACFRYPTKLARPDGPKLLLIVLCTRDKTSIGKLMKTSKINSYATDIQIFMSAIGLLMVHFEANGRLNDTGESSVHSVSFG
jgi:hypothetical protein